MAMTPEELMNKILAHACPSVVDVLPGINEFYIETHCVAWKVRARCITKPQYDEDDNNIVAAKYEVISVVLVDI